MISRAPTVIVDTSVALSCLLPAATSAAAEHLLLHDAWIAPESAVLEACGVFAGLQRTGQLDHETALLAVHAFPRLYEEIVPVTPLVSLALALAVELSVTPEDAVYLALAEREGLPVVTGRQALAEAVRGTRFESMVLRLAEAHALA